MAVADGREISLEYTLTLDDGTVADTNVGGDPLVYTQGQGQILPALEHELTGMKPGDSKEVDLTAEQGYGKVDPQLYREVDLSAIPEEARKVGQVLVGQDGNGRPFQVRVKEIKDDTAILDLNHPLAGQALHFDVKIVDVQAAQKTDAAQKPDAAPQQ